MKKRTVLRYDTARVARIIMLRKKGGVTYVLLVHSVKRDEWELPGGKLKRHESYEKGARREMLEETGLRLLTLNQFLIWQHDVVSIDSTLTTRTIKRYFVSSSRSKKGRPNGTDVDELRWFALRDTLTLANIKHETRTILELIGLGVTKKSLSIRQITHFDTNDNNTMPDPQH